MLSKPIVASAVCLALLATGSPASAAQPRQAISNYSIQRVVNNPVEPYGIGKVDVMCPAGTQALTGGALTEGSPTVRLDSSLVLGDVAGTGWSTSVRNMVGTPQTFVAYAI